MKRLKPRDSIRIIGAGATVLIALVMLGMFYFVFALFTGKAG